MMYLAMAKEVAVTSESGGYISMYSSILEEDTSDLLWMTVESIFRWIQDPVVWLCALSAVIILGVICLTGASSSVRAMER